MLPTLLENGDVLERAFANFICARLPEYSRLWSRYIGNDGMAQLPFADVLAPRLQKKREESAAFTYTALEALLCCRLIVIEVENRQIGSAKPDEEIDAYLRAVNAISSFYAQVGRVADSFRHLSELWHDPQLCRALNEYYKQRNNVLHEASIPCRFKGGILYVVEPQGELDDTKRWGKRRRWSDADGMIVTALPDLLRKVLEACLTLANNAYGRLIALHMAEQFRPVVEVMQTHYSLTATAKPASSSSMGVAIVDWSGSGADLQCFGIQPKKTARDSER